MGGTVLRVTGGGVLRFERSGMGGMVTSVAAASVAALSSSATKVSPTTRNVDKHCGHTTS